jgi:hypothetical protein
MRTYRVQIVTSTVSKRETQNNNDMVYNIYCVFREIFLHRQQFVENSEIINFPLQNFVSYIALCYVAKYNTKDMLF